MNGQQLAVYQTMKEFITKKYYPTEVEPVEILKAFLITQDITPEQQTELTLLARDTYNPPVIEPEEPPVEDPVA